MRKYRKDHKTDEESRVNGVRASSPHVRHPNRPRKIIDERNLSSQDKEEIVRGQSITNRTRARHSNRPMKIINMRDL